MNDRLAHAPKYLVIADKIKTDLMAECGQGGYLPTEYYLTAKHGVNRLTIRKALKHLENERIVSPTISKKRRLLVGAAPNRRTPVVVGCIGYGNSGKPDEQEFGNPVFQQILVELVHSFQKKGCGIMPIILDPVNPAYVPELPSVGLLRGCIVFYHSPAIKMLQERISRPTLAFEFFYNGHTENVIAPNGTLVAMRAARYLMERGHRALAMLHIEHPVPYPFNDDACCGFTRACHLGGLQQPPRIVAVSPEAARDDALLERILKRLLADEPALSALVVCSIDFGCQIAGVLKKMGVAVPRRISILTLGGSTEKNESGFMTGFMNDYPRVADFIREHMLNLISGQLTDIGVVKVDFFKLVEGPSVVSVSRKA